MSLTERSIDTDDAAVSLDRELEALQQAVARARRNRWHGGDILEPEFEQYLAALTDLRPPAHRPATTPTVAAWDAPANPWREALAS